MLELEREQSFAVINLSSDGVNVRLMVTVRAMVTVRIRVSFAVINLSSEGVNVRVRARAKLCHYQPN